MILLIDIGNTRVKYAHNQSLLSIQWVLHNDLEPLLNTLSDEAITQIMIASGRSKTALTSLEKITTATKKLRNLNTRFVQVCPSLLSPNYQDITQFGVDRFLNLLGARERYHSHFCVVSCGTAITLDFYTTQHIGGMILPGLNTSATLLSEKTGLDYIEKPESLLGYDTATSIGAGLYIGYQNLIDASIEHVAKAFDQRFKPVLTGGDAAQLYPYHECIDTLLFEGMQYYSRIKQ